MFDDIFYRQFNRGEDHLDPSLNFLTLVAVLWFLLSPRRADPRGLTRGLTITSLISLAFVFGVVPADWIVRVPLLKNIVHIDNTFSCVAIVCLLVLAGFGIKTFWNDCSICRFQRTYLRVMVLLIGLVALYLGTTEAGHAFEHPASLGEHIPEVELFLGLFALAHAGGGSLAVARTFTLLTRGARIVQGVFLILLFVLFHWRHGMHLATPFDAYVMNPQRRVNLMADSSAALQLVKSRTAEPSRSAGLDWAFFPGYGGAVGSSRLTVPILS